MNEEKEKTKQRTRHREPIEESYPQFGYDEIPAKQNNRSTGISSLYLCEREKIDNHRDSSENSKSAGTRT